jgi:hypothetical protein
MTPRQFGYLVARHKEKTSHEELLPAITSACVVNHSAFPPKKAATPGMFMPSRFGRKDDGEPKKPRRSRKAEVFGVRTFLLGQVQRRKGL